MMGWHAIKEFSNKPLLILKARHSLVPRPFPPAVFDHLQYSDQKLAVGMDWVARHPVVVGLRYYLGRGGS